MNLTDSINVIQKKMLFVLQINHERVVKMFKIKLKNLCYVIPMVLLSSSLLLAESYYKVPLSQLAFEDPSQKLTEIWIFAGGNNLLPYAIGDNGEEIYLAADDIDSPGEHAASLLIKTDSGNKPSGALIYNRFNSYDYVKFKVNTASGDPSILADEFIKAKSDYYSWMSESGYPGAAYFRHLAQNAEGDNQPVERSGNDTDLEQMMQLFSGSRAVSENIQLDRDLRLAGEDTDLVVDLNDVKGITVREFDWQALTKDIELHEDKLAKLIPHDQYALFFQDFDSMTNAIDYADKNFSQLKGIVEGRSINALTLDRYQKQLCLPLDEFSKIIGRQLIKSVVFTGSDPYLRTGSDVAVVFETARHQALLELVSQYHAGASRLHMHSSLVSGKVEGVTYQGIETNDRSVCSYAAVVADAVVVTNSKYQLKQIIKTSNDKYVSMDSLAEYKFFRSRYDAAAGKQSVFLIVTDAAIRKWCGPRWRIAAARRTIAMAKIAELQARYFDASIKKGAPAFEPETPIGLGMITIANNMVVSDEFGALTFQVPIAEMAIDKISTQEQLAYSRFRESYQRRWANFFDPIAASISISDEKSGLDLTVMPLILGSEYREIANVTSPGNLAADAGVMNDDTMFEITISLNKQSQFFQMFKGQFTGMAAGSGAQGITPDYDPFSWMGEWLTINIQKDKIWSEIAGQAEKEKTSVFRILERRLSAGKTDIPISLLFDVDNKIGANTFLVTLRGMMESISPFAIASEPKFYDNKKYIKLILQTGGSTDEKFNIYYAVADDVLIFSLSEDVVKSLLDGKLCNKERKQSFYEGANMAVKVDSGMINFIESNGDLKKQIYNECWRNLPILNYYRNELGVQDPVAVHTKYWGETLECPAGGEYIWDDDYQTYTSTALGHPGDIKTPDRLFGFEGIEAFNSSLKFENDGIRVKAELKHNRD